MNTKPRVILVGGIEVHVVRKAIKNLHLGVYPPAGRVRVAVPLAVSDDAVRLAVIGKLGWIKRQKARFQEQQRQSKREMVSGESHYFLGRRYRLRVIEHDGAFKVVMPRKESIELYVRPQTETNRREQVLQDWYRQQLRTLIPALLEKWQPILGVRVEDWGIKKMKTKWGSCNKDARRIWINLELAKKPVECLEYIIVHEMTHLIEPHHNDRFRTLMDKVIPQWNLRRARLNRAPLGYEKWEY
jgi:predicted metal-dependent hydrolase